jgi:hypothetical protein
MKNRNSGPKKSGIAGLIITYGVLTATALGLLLAGCASTSSETPAEIAAMEKTELHFSLDQCEPLNEGLFKCPPKDKPICDPYYNGQFNCVRIGKKGNVFVEKFDGEI